jgi:glycosyltransferase involved in cell wall biosynthesis
MSSGLTLPRILYVTPFWPQRVGIGSEVRSRQVLRALQALGKVDVAVLDDGEDTSEPREKRLADGREFGVMQMLDVKPQPSRGIRGKLGWFVNPRSDYPHGWGVDGETAVRFMREAAGYDLVWFFKLRAANMFPDAKWANSVVDIDDVLSEVESTTAKSATIFKQRLLARARSFSWRRREKILGTRFNALTVCSEADKSYLTQLGVSSPVHVVPNGFDCPAEPPQRKPVTPPRIGFIGYFDYLPNRDGVQWFVENCWPVVKRELPDARLRLVGRGTDGLLRPCGADIDGLGWLANPADEIASWSGMIVPIRLGGGTRVKIAQAFGLKCPVVATSLGAFGYEVRDGQELFLADEPAAFAVACVKTVRDQAAAAAMAERAWQKLLANWTWAAIEPRIHAAARAAMNAA